MKEYNLDGVMNELVSVMRRPESVPNEIAETVSAITEISGKTSKTLHNFLSLLKLVPKIQDACPRVS